MSISFERMYNVYVTVPLQLSHSNTLYRIKLVYVEKNAIVSPQNSGEETTHLRLRITLVPDS